ncbi:transposable element Tcb1 transposase [Trichonephila clavipes]|nr:transposable element Tcb1 transposase [Trichonephila clavipes]
MLGQCIAARPRPPATVRDLEIALLEEWNSIPQSLIDNLIASMTNRRLVIKFRIYLSQHERLFRGALGAEFLFMDDNTRPHHANIVDECLQSEDIARMDWPAYSPDLNRIEHVWYMLDRRIAARQPPPTCLTELRRALLDEW